MDDTINDIGTALMRLRAAFAKHGIPCPDVLEYSDPAKAYNAAVPLRHALSAVTWAMNASAAPHAEASLYGFTLRFEAKQIERPGTGLELDDGIRGRIVQDNMKGGE